MRLKYGVACPCTGGVSAHLRDARGRLVLSRPGSYQQLCLARPDLYQQIRRHVRMVPMIWFRVRGQVAFPHIFGTRVDVQCLIPCAIDQVLPLRELKSRRVCTWRVNFEPGVLT